MKFWTYLVPSEWIRSLQNDDGIDLSRRIQPPSASREPSRLVQIIVSNHLATSFIVLSRVYVKHKRSLTRMSRHGSSIKRVANVVSPAEPVEERSRRHL